MSFSLPEMTVDTPLRRVLGAFAQRGLNLAERLAPGAEGNGQGLPADSEFTSRIHEWKGRLERLDLWTERLGALGADEARFFARAIKGGRLTDYRFGRDLQTCLASILALAQAGASPTRRYAEGLPPLPPALEQYVVRYIEGVMRDRTPIHEDHCVDLAGLITQETNGILAELHELLVPTLVTELHVARALGVLPGESPEDRFTAFCRDRLQSAEWLTEYFETYPVVARLTEQLTRTRCSAFVELLERFERDCLALAGLLGDDPARPKLGGLSDAKGEHHRGGRAVRVLELTGGTRIVYKPRPVDIDVVFQDTIRWLNAKGFRPELFVLPIIARPGYGWFRFLDRPDCTDERAVGRFYRRHGANMALLYLLGGYDFFRDNVRAYGEHPVLVDLECVQAPVLPAYNGRLFDSAARRYLEESVYRAGMLPAWNWVYLGEQGVNLSALTLTDGQEAPQDVLEWTERGSDRVRQKRVRALLKTDHLNLPTLGGVAVPVNDFMDELFHGFRDAYDVLARHKAELLEPDSVLAAFGPTECRLVLRGTVDYATLLTELRHPDYLGDALRYSELLDRLWISRCPRYTACTLDSEIAQLWSGDVPVFTTRGSSRALFDDRGSVVERHYLEETALEGARRRLQRFGPDDCSRQIQIMNCAFAVTELPHVADQTLVRPRAGPFDGGREAKTSNAQLIAEACHIADRILEVSIEDERTVTWIGLGANRVGQWDQTSLDSGLYDGGPGIALFLSALHQITGVARYGDVCQKIVQYVCVDASRQVLENHNRLEDWVIFPPTAFMYPFSALYLSTHLEPITKHAGLETMLDAALAWGEAGLGKKPRFDFLNGAAGLVRVLLVAHRATGDGRTLGLARAYADQLVQHAMPMTPGVAWRSDMYPVPVGGFSHGTASIGWVLAELAHATGDERYMHTAQEALRYDRSLFSADREEWFDLRFSQTQHGNSVQWCHGVAGIGLARSLLWRLLGDESLARDVCRAVDMTLSADVPSDCLCHGSMGNLECCAVAAHVMQNAEWGKRVLQAASARWLRAHQRGYWATGIPGRNIGVYGLFMGTAGIGMALLRLARPDIVPSVLFLEDPKPRVGSNSPA
jgi:type 2 lantibiotic biosynthesis protein LanM